MMDPKYDRKGKTDYCSMTGGSWDGDQLKILCSRDSSHVEGLTK